MFGLGEDKDVIPKVMRNLWEVHVKFTRIVILGIANDSPSLLNNLRDLLKNQDDIGNTIRKKYGDNAADLFTSLLKEHIMIAGDLLKSAKVKDTKSVDQLKKRWYQNADKIAEFLSKLNSKWSYEKIKSALYDHLALTLNEGVAQLKGLTDVSLSWYHKALGQIIRVADMLSYGLLNQIALHGYHVAGMIV